MTRFSTLSPMAARAVAAALALLLALTVFAFPAAPMRPGVAVPALDSDAGLYRGIAAEVGAAHPYYEVMADAHRAQGYPLKPVMTVRLPTLAWISGALGPVAMQWVMAALATLTLSVWFLRLREHQSLPVTAAALFVMTITIIPFSRAPLPLFHESWAGVLVALSLGVRRNHAVWVSIAVALMAALLRETAMPLLVMMALLAAMSRRWKETLAWSAALAIWGVAYAGHALAVADIVRPSDFASPGWSGMGGWPTFVDAIIKTTPLAFVPLVAAGPLVALALAGWASVRGGLGLRVTGWLSGMAAMIMLFARPDNFYWAILPAPLLLAGLAFVPQALADLWAATQASDRRLDFGPA